MNQWVVNGLRTGIKTTAYPARLETAAGATPGLPFVGDLTVDKVPTLMACCPTGVFSGRNDRVLVDRRRCIHCYRCVRSGDHSVEWQQDYEWASICGGSPRLGKPFRRSIHVLVVDAGDCGACLNEVKQLNNPYYNMHRLGFFITPTPRHADVLLVVGAATEHMRFALKKIYDAMPAPRCVVAVGACALTGGTFSESFVCAKGLAEVLPVDVEVAGNPPPPLAILHGLLVAVGRKMPTSSTYVANVQK